MRSSNGHMRISARAGEAGMSKRILLVEDTAAPISFSWTISFRLVDGYEANRRIKAGKGIGEGGFECAGYCRQIDKLI